MAKRHNFFRKLLTLELGYWEWKIRNYTGNCEPKWNNELGRRRAEHQVWILDNHGIMALVDFWLLLLEDALEA